MEPGVHCRVHKNPPLYHNLSQLNSVNALTPYLFKIQCNRGNPTIGDLQLEARQGQIKSHPMLRSVTNLDKLQKYSLMLQWHIAHFDTVHSDKERAYTKLLSLWQILNKFCGWKCQNTLLFIYAWKKSVLRKVTYP